MVFDFNKVYDKAPFLDGERSIVFEISNDINSINKTFRRFFRANNL